MEKYTCPCCGYKSFSQGPGSDQICPICFWHDDLSQLRFVETTGANKVTLIQAQENYGKYGACEERLIPHVRKPSETDLKDVNWKKFNPAIHKIENSITDMDYGTTYSENLTDYYYWNK